MSRSGRSETDVYARFALLLGSVTLACSVYDASLIDSVGGGAAGTSSKGVGGTHSLGGTLSQAGHGSVSSGNGGVNSNGGDGSGHASGGVTQAAGSAGAGRGGGTAGSSAAGSGGVISKGGAAGAEPGGTPELIDNVEDRNVYVQAQNGRSGYWYTSKDSGSSTTITTLGLAPLLEPARGDSKYGWHVTGGGYKIWGSQLGILFKNDKTPYNASNYCGIRFFAKGEASYVLFEISDKYSDPNGKLCDVNATSGATQCYDHMVAAIEIPSVWGEVVVPFSSLQRKGYAIPSQPLARDGLFTLALTFADPTGEAFDIWVDDIFFSTKASGATKCPGE